MMTWLLGSELGPTGTLQFITPQWVMLLAGAVALVAWGVAWLGERPLWRQLVELTLWGLTLAGVLLAIARPVWVEEEGRTEPGRVAVLIDGSRSMSILEGKKPRSEHVQKVLEQLTGADVDIYHFGSQLSTGVPTSYDLSSTDIEGAMAALSERVAGERLSGVVLISDGLDLGLLRRRFEREENPAPLSIPGPLTVYQVGTPGTLHDLSVRSIDSGGFAFRSEPFTITAHLLGAGYAGRRVTATLSRDGRPVTARNVTLDEEGKAIATFELQPDKVGRFTYEVSVPIWDDDAVPSNNSAPVVVHTVRDRISVLQVAGAPSWDVKFLRRFLKGDPSVDLVSFFILRTTDDIDDSYEDYELSLIQFPYEDLFDEELDRFDIIIFQNFDYDAYFRADPEGLLTNIQQFVEEDGKGFVMVGGERSFDLGGYGGTSIEDMLPVDLRVSEPLIDETHFRSVLTPDGERHPVTRLLPDPAQNQAWWKRLSKTDGVNRVGGLSADATVLLEHPTLKGRDGRPMPVLSVAEAGKGRAMALTVDTSWRWSLTEAAHGRGNQAYLRFWKNAFKWLMKDPESSRVTVDTPQENYGVGDPVRIIVRARDTGFAPLERAEVIAYVDGPDGRTEIEGVTTAGGDGAPEFPAAVRGAHRVSVEVRHRGKVVGKDKTVFAVTTRDPELDEVSPDAEFLKWLATSTGGKFFGPEQVGAPIRDPSSGRTVWERREAALWRAPILGIWILLFGGLTWIVRRRSGMR